MATASLTERYSIEFAPSGVEPPKTYDYFENHICEIGRAVVRIHEDNGGRNETYAGCKTDRETHSPSNELDLLQVDTFPTETLEGVFDPTQKQIVVDVTQSGLDCETSLEFTGGLNVNPDASSLDQHCSGNKHMWFTLKLSERRHIHCAYTAATWVGVRTLS